MGFHGKYVVVEGGAVADVGHPRIALPVIMDDNGINADLWAQFVLQIDIGGGDAQQFATPVPTVGHGAADLVVAAQHLARFFDLAAHDQFPDGRAADAVVVDGG